MLTTKLFNYVIIYIFIFERLIELLVNQYNKKIMVKNYAAKVKFPREALQMRIFHSLWFVALLVETNSNGKMLDGFSLYFCVLILILAQSLRWYAIFSLGSNWSVDVYQMKGHPIIEKGPYAYIRHPNYLAVIIEFIFLPLLLGCFYTLLIGSIANFFILKRRIALEEQALEDQFYKRKFDNKNYFLIKGLLILTEYL